MQTQTSTTTTSSTLQGKTHVKAEEGGPTSEVCDLEKWRHTPTVRE
jgi:hypothetical protein